jgi:hypothetical protein
MFHSPATPSPSLALESAKLLEIISVNMRSNATSAPPSSSPFSFKQFNDLIAGIELLYALARRLSDAIGHQPCDGSPEQEFEKR